jgi:hypothetical protein
MATTTKRYAVSRASPVTLTLVAEDFVTTTREGADCSPRYPRTT